MDVRTTPELRIQNSPNGLELINPYLGLSYDVNVLLEPYCLDILHYCFEGKSFNQVCDYLYSLASGNLTISQCEASVSHLVESMLLEKLSSSPLYKSAQALEHWETQGWSDALSFHIHTNFLEKSNYTEDPKGVQDKEIMKSYLKEEPPPSPYKTYSEDAHRVPLIAYQDLTISQERLNFIFEDKVGMARSQQPFSFEEFSWYMNLAFGQTGQKNLPITGAHLRKTVPSGGSRHPTEVYVIMTSEGPIAAGLYHYDVKSHALVLIQSGDHSTFVREHVITHPQRPHFKCHAAFIFSTMFERSMFRYRESRSYRVLHYDLGHIMQNTALIASALNRNSYRGYSFHDDLVDKFLQIDTLNESAMAFALLG